jgi:trehalose 6-phosphate synthase
VAKEGPVVNRRDGVLVLSNGAGAFQELGEGALAVNPRDVEGTAEALWQALIMPASERRRRAALLCAAITERSLLTWMSEQLEELHEVAVGTVVASALVDGGRGSWRESVA